MSWKLLVTVVLPVIVFTLKGGHSLAENYLLGQEFPIVNYVDTRHDDRPAVAFGSVHRNLHVVRQEEQAGYMSRAGCVISEKGETTACWYSTGSQSRDPDIAYDFKNDRYMMVWSHYNDARGSWEIHAQYTPGGYLDRSDPVPLYGNEAVNYQRPRIAFGYNVAMGRYEYIMICQMTDAVTGVLEGIVWRRLGTDGAPIDTGASLVGYRGFPQIVFVPSTAEYVFVWTEAVAGGTTDIYAARANMDGAILGSPTPVDTALNNQQSPRVATDGQGRLLFTWEHDYNGLGTDWDLRGKLLDPALNPLASAFQIAWTSANEQWVALACNPLIGEFLIVWQQETGSGKQIMRRRLDPDNNLTESLEVTEAGLYDNRSPAATAYSQGFLILYATRGYEPEDKYDVVGKFLRVNRGFVTTILQVLVN